MSQPDSYRFNKGILQITILVTGVLSLFAVSANPQSDHAILANNCSSKLLQGAWQLESAIYHDQNGKVVAEIQNQTTKSRKLIAGQHFSFITWQADGKFDVAASGTFSADPVGYHEQVDATSLPRLQHKTYHFQCQLKGDDWLHQGLEDGVYIKEHWRKLGAG